MPTSFVPLLPPTGTSLPTAAFKLKVISSETGGEGRGAGAEGGHNPGENHGECKKSRPEITFQKEGDVISKIRIVCPCGQVIELGCQY